MTETTQDAGMISEELAARLLCVETTELTKLRRMKIVTPVTTSPVKYRLSDVVREYVKHLRGEKASAAECAQHLDLNRRNFHDLIDRGVVGRQPERGYVLADVRLSYIRHLRETAAGRSEAADPIASARARLLTAKAEQAEGEAKRANSGYAPISTLKVALARSMTALRELLLSTPGQLAHRLVGLDRASIHRELDRHMRAVLNSIADGHIARAVEAGGPVTEAEKAAHEASQ
ncbi:hypothetical protein AS156_25240 [Bradyrhizobium macuxiense]|uniref:Phage terminase Nu1 subunit (DNA packaging protein) n=4 Tax=Bradyrhizobium macuxiense TaxID=1755647 RepID=A0A109J6S7_9BRAD|nr:hypothetical protein AS156_25240 [Bradyrhizobium macuxiense]